MTKEQFEVKIKELLPAASETALASFTEYAKTLDEQGIELASDFFDSLYVELSLVKRDYGEETAGKLFNLGETFTLNPFEIRGAATLLKEGNPLESIATIASEDGCDPSSEEEAESRAALATFQKKQTEMDTSESPASEQ